MKKLAGLGLLVALVPGLALGEVVGTAPNGFSLRNSASVAATPEEIWEAIVDVAGYWHPDHTWAGDAGTMTIDARPGGCFCEAIPGGSVEHLRVVYVDRPKVLRMEGGLGPLQAMGVSGSFTWTVTAADGGSVVELAYVVSGFFPEEGSAAAIAAAVDGVQKQAVERLVRFAETGAPE